MKNPVALTYSHVAALALPPSAERDELIQLLNTEDPDDNFSRRTVKLLLDIAIGLAGKSES